jgi:hypothetical protein
LLATGGGGATTFGGGGGGGVQALNPAIAAAPRMAKRRTNVTFGRNEAASIINKFPGKPAYERQE